MVLCCARTGATDDRSGGVCSPLYNALRFTTYKTVFLLNLRIVASFVYHCGGTEYETIIVGRCLRGVVQTNVPRTACFRQRALCTVAAACAYTCRNCCQSIAFYVYHSVFECILIERPHCWDLPPRCSLRQTRDDDHNPFYLVHIYILCSGITRMYNL